MIRRIAGTLLFCVCLAIPFAYGQSTTFPSYFPGYISTLPSGLPISGTESMIILQGGNVKSIPLGSVPTVLGAGIIVAVRSSAAATVTVSASTDYFLCLDPSGNAITVSLPGSPATGLTYLIKDCTGNAQNHNITIVPAAGNIDGAPNFIMSVKSQSTALTYTGTQWSLN